jgi:hypothetical protein
MDDLRSWLSGQDKELGDFLTMIRNWAEPLLVHGMHTGYTDHTIAHSDRVIVYLSRISQVCLLNKYEACILIGASYVHDIGMQDLRSGNELKEIRDLHHLLSGEIIRELGRHNTDNSIFSMHIPFDEVFNFVSLVAEGHRAVDIHGKKYDSHHLNNMEIRLRLLAALLRLADELDIDYQRAPIRMTLLSNYPPSTLVHWYKSHYVGSVEVSGYKITIYFRFPENYDANYIKIFHRLVYEKIRIVVEEVNEIFKENGFVMAMVKPVVETNPDISVMPLVVAQAALKEAEEVANVQYQKIEEDIKFYRTTSPELLCSI